jgi:hypothetical protein
MNLTNESYLIKISGKTATEYYFKENGAWYKVSYRGRRFKATPEQILNHILPAVSGVKPNVSIRVEHYEDPKMRPLPESMEKNGK